MRYAEDLQFLQLFVQTGPRRGTSRLMLGLSRAEPSCELIFRTCVTGIFQEFSEYWKFDARCFASAPVGASAARLPSPHGSRSPDARPFHVRRCSADSIPVLSPLAPHIIHPAAWVLRLVARKPGVHLTAQVCRARHVVARIAAAAQRCARSASRLSRRAPAPPSCAARPPCAAAGAAGRRSGVPG